MRRLRLQATILATLALCLVATSVPVSAQSNPMLPPLAELTSVRFDYLSTFNDEPGVVCQGEIASPARLHQVCQELVTAQEPELDVDAVTGRVTKAAWAITTYPHWPTGPSTEELLAALAAAVARNDPATTAVILEALESHVPPELLADILQALLQRYGDDHEQIALCA
jgi:hypothetical protein